MKFKFKHFPSTLKHSVDPLYFTMFTEYILFPFKCCTSVNDTGKKSRYYVEYTVIHFNPYYLQHPLKEVCSYNYIH